MTVDPVIIPGDWIVTYTNTFPARRYKYRHDRVSVGGALLPGHIQVRVRHGRVDVMTADGQGACVLGHDVDWLIRRAKGGA